MDGFPQRVTREQVRAVCAVLGLPVDRVRSFTCDAAEGLTVDAFLTDSDGRKVAHGDEPVSLTIRVPFPMD